MAMGSPLQDQQRIIHRRPFLKVVLWACAFIALSSMILSFYITQPTLGRHLAPRSSTLNLRRLEEHVKVLSEDLVPRDQSHPENLDRVADYIKGQFSHTHGLVSEQPFQVRGRTYRNVIVTFGPPTEDRLVVGAHYDAAGPFPGADDNASGVAGLIELAYMLDGAGIPVGSQLVAFSLEEPPYFRTEMMGSAIHALSLKRNGVEVRAMICLEMIGYFSDEPNS